MDEDRTLNGSPARLLDAADRLFYRDGLRAVGVDAVVAEAGVATKTLYVHFGSKDGLIEAYLRRRDQRWLCWLRAAIREAGPGPARVLAVFDALGEWFATPGFNGCAFINAAGELATGTTAREIARGHKRQLHALLRDLATDSGAAEPAQLANHLMLLVEGAIVAAHIDGNPGAAASARSAAVALLRCQRSASAVSPAAAGTSTGAS